MMKISTFSIRRRITLTMIYFIAIGFGIFSVTQLEIDLLPDIEFPIVGVITNYPGVGPEDIENLVSRPIEASVSATKNVENITSQSMEGSSIVLLEFSWNADMDQAEIDVRNRIDLIRDSLPDDASAPLVIAFDPSMMPVMYLSLNSPSMGPAELRELAEDRIQPMLERVEGVASAGIQGGLVRQINVKLNPTLLASYNLSPEDVALGLQAGSGLMPAGNIETTTKKYNLRVYSEYNSLDQINNTIISMQGSLPVYVKDVAVVEDGYDELSSDVRTNFGQGVAMLVSKQSDANTVQTAGNVKAALPDIEALLPDETQISIIFDQSDFIMRSVNNLTSTAAIAFILAFIIIYIFLRNFKASIIMGIAIPVSVIVTFAVMMAGGITLNIISMAGLALAIGMLVDNSIVVLENIMRHNEMGEDQCESSDMGAQEVGMAITASTLTTISVFIPVLFIPGMTGQLFKDMVITICFSLGVSLIVALSLVTMLSARFLTKKSGNGKAPHGLKRMLDSFFNILTAKYKVLLHWSIYHKAIVLGFSLLLLALSLATIPMLGGDFMPRTDQSSIQVTIERAPGTPLDELRQTVSQLEAIVREEVPELQNIFLSFGAGEGMQSIGTTASTIEMMVQLVPMEERERSQFEIEDKLRDRIDRIPGITYSIAQSSGFSSEQDIDVRIYSHDISAAKEIATQIMEKMKTVEGLVDIDINIESSAPELQVHLNQDAINDFNLSRIQVATFISTALQGRTAAYYRELGDEFDVYVRFDKAYREDRDVLREILIPLPEGSSIPVKQVATIGESVSPSTIFRENQERYVSVGCALSEIDLSSAVGAVEQIIDDTPIPSDFIVSLGGAAEDQQESFFYLMVAFVVAILLVYMIMASQFESLVDPLVIMFTIPFSVIGVFGLLFITGTTISVMSLVGLVMLVGIAVNNGIVLVDYTNQLRGKGLSLYEAVEEGGVARMRPVLMTALTTILGMVPLAFEIGSGAENWSPMAKSVIGGLITTTMLTLINIPVLYIVFELLGEKVRHLFGISKDGI